MFKFLTSKSNLLGIIILIIGLAAGVILVMQSQEIRNRAQENGIQLVMVCHNNQLQDEWEAIQVPEQTLQLHIDHGDILGECPEGFEQTPDGDSFDTRKDLNGSKRQETSRVADNSSNSETIEADENQDILVSPTQNPLYSGPNSLKFFITLQGIGSKSDDKNLVVSFFKGEDQVYTFPEVKITSNANGVYTGEVSGVSKGSYEVKFKGPTYLQRAYDGVNIVSGENTWYFTNSPLLAGDFNNDNVIDVQDIAEFMATYPGIGQFNAKYDINSDGSVDEADLDIVLSNYENLNTLGE